jgi:hypothetical protein
MMRLTHRIIRLACRCQIACFQGGVALFTQRLRSRHTLICNVGHETAFEARRGKPAIMSDEWFHACAPLSASTQPCQRAQASTHQM